MNWPCSLAVCVCSHSARSVQRMDDSQLRPSFFELYASERLTSALRPALRYVLEVLSVRNQSVMPLLPHSDDIFTSICVILEASQLITSSSTLAESFYGLRRDTSFDAPSNSGHRTGLSRSQIVLSLLFNVILPHLKLKMDDAFASLSGGPLSNLMNPQVLHSLRGSSQTRHLMRRSIQDVRWTAENICARIQAYISTLWSLETFVRWYPIFNSVYEGTGLIFNVLYLFGHTRHFNQYLALQRLVVRRLSGRELMNLHAESVVSSSRADHGKHNAGSLVSAGVKNTLAAAKQAFIISIFVFRFLEHYFAAEVRICISILYLSSRFCANLQAATYIFCWLQIWCFLPTRVGQSRAPRQETVVPPPPSALRPAPGVDVSCARSKLHCPLCHQLRVNPAACVRALYFSQLQTVVQHVISSHDHIPQSLCRFVCLILPWYDRD